MLTKKEIRVKLIKVRDEILKLLWKEEDWRSSIEVKKLVEKYNKKDFRIHGDLQISDSNCLYWIHIQLTEAWYDNEPCGPDDDVCVAIIFNDGESTLQLHQHYYPDTRPESIVKQFKLLHSDIDKIIHIERSKI